MAYLFGDCKLDPDRHELQKQGRAVAVEPKAFDVLLYLVEHRDRLIGREEFNRQIWGGRHVSDWALSTCIKNARLAIGDSGKRQDYIRTVPRKGFRFVGNVEVRGQDRAAAAPDTDAIVSGLTDPSLAGRPSIAVLPLENMSGNPEQEYFSDGMTEDIITALSRLRWLLVIARNSTFTYKGKAVDVKRIGRDMGARYVLEGSVRKAGSRVRVSVQLIQAETGNHIWAQRYDRELADIFALQDELTEAISANVDAELAGSERQFAHGKNTDLNAWDLYQRGMWHYYKYSKDGFAKARPLFDRAIKKAPEFARPFSALAITAYSQSAQGYVDDAAAVLDQGLRDAKHAIALDDRDSFNHYTLGQVCIVLGERKLAVSAMQTAIDLNPNSAMAYHGLAIAHYWFGDPALTLPLVDHAIRLSPHDPALFSFYLFRGGAHAVLGNHEQAIVDGEKSIRQPYANFWPHLLLVSANSALGRGEEARQALDGAKKLLPDVSIFKITSMLRNFHPPYLESYLNNLRAAGVPER
jgi:TolB-like protein